jgi:hypothetical protein
MQQMVSQPRPNITPDQQRNTRKQSLIITGITLFALSGLLVGFAVGAINRPQHPRTSSGLSVSPVANQQSQSATPTVAKTTQVLPLGFPVITQVSSPEMADGTTSYTFTAHPVDQSIDKGHGKQVHAPDITCKIWLTKEENVTGTLQDAGDRLHNVGSLSQPLPKEVQNAFTFTGGNQTQNCSANGDTTWKYQLAPSVNHGVYNIVILTDWAGQRYNWSWVHITVNGDNN